MSDRPPSTAVVEAVADEEGVEPALLSPPLYEVIDPEALNSLVDGAGEEFRLQFGYAGHLVRIDADGTVRVDP